MTTDTRATDRNMSDEAIRRGSGRTWGEWFAILDDWGATQRTHTEIARYIHEEHGVDGWWAQGITVGYERARGMRDLGQRPDGSYDASASKTFPVPITALFAAWTDEAQRDRWLAPGTLSLRTTQGTHSARFDDVEYGGIIALWFTDKGPEKSSVAIQVDKLPSQDAVAERKQVWKARLAELATFLKG